MANISNTSNLTRNPCLKSQLIYQNIIFSQLILSLITNVLLIFLILQSTKLRRNISNQVFLNIPFTHVLGASTMLALRYHMSYQLFMLTNALLLQMFLSLMLTSLDRFFVIKYPYKYQKLTQKHTFLISMTTWSATSIFYSVTLQIRMAPVMLISLVISLISISSLILMFTNLSIFLIARHHVGAILKTSVGSNKHINARKPAYTCFALVATFVICWCPDLTHSIMIICGKQTYNSNGCDLISPITAIVYHLNSLFDPLIYVFLKRDIKEEIKKIWRCLTKCVTKESLRNEDTELTLFVSTAY